MARVGTVSSSALALVIGFLGLSVPGTGSAEEKRFVDPLEQPAVMAPGAEHEPMLAIAAAGRRFAAVGLRGKAVWMNVDTGEWHQADVPVRVDLVALSFPDTRNGWAVGHGGVVLHSADGGETWRKQLDGMGAAKVARSFYERLAADGDEHGTRQLERLGFLAEGGKAQAFLDVWFEDANRGFVVGTFGWIFRTTDGGETWEPWMHRVDNPMELHFYSVNGRGGHVFLAGEQGQVWRLNEERTGFKAHQTPYMGTFFGSVLEDDRIVVFGMRGTAYQGTLDGETWRKVDVNGSAGITGGTLLSDGRPVLVDQVGVVRVGDRTSMDYAKTSLSSDTPIFDVAAGEGASLGLAGPTGVRIGVLK